MAEYMTRPKPSRDQRERLAGYPSVPPSATGISGRIKIQHTEAMKYSPAIRYSGIAQLSDHRTTYARMIGLSTAPTCPDVFIAALSSPEYFRPMSMHEAQLGASVNIELALATAINTAATRGFSVAAPDIIAIPATA